MNRKKPNPPRRCIVSRPPGQMPRVICPPPTPKHFVSRSSSSPLSGPASGLWPSGSNPPAPAAAASPASPPAPSCFTASLFSDCFSGCMGTINGGSPGPICGWTYNEAFGPLGGSIAFTPGIMSFDTTAAPDYPGASKPLPASLPDVLNLTLRYSFTEYQSVPTPATAYQIAVNNFDNSLTAFLSMYGDGSFFLQVGLMAATPSYLGTWTPNGGSHEVHLTVDAVGTPALFIDGVAMALPFFGNVASFSSLFPADSVTLFAGSDQAGPQSSPVTGVFVSAGVLPETTEFCCP